MKHPDCPKCYVASPEDFGISYAWQVKDAPLLVKCQLQCRRCGKRFIWRGEGIEAVKILEKVMEQTRGTVRRISTRRLSSYRSTSSGGQAADQIVF